MTPGDRGPHAGRELARLARNALAFGAGRAGAQALALVTIPIALSAIPPAAYGLYTLLQIAALAGGVLMGLGTSTALVSRFAEIGASPRANLLGRMLSQQALLGGGLLAALCLASLPLGRALAPDEPPALLPVLLVGEYAAALVLVFARWQTLTDRHAEAARITGIRAAALLAGVALLVVVQGRGLMGFALAECGAKLTALALCVGSARGHLRLEVRAADTGAILRRGLPSAPYALLFWSTVSLPLYALRAAGDAAAAGALSLAWRLAQPLDVAGHAAAFGAAGRIVAAGRAGPGDSLQHWHRLALAGFAVLGCGLVALGPELLALLFPPEYARAARLLPCTVLGGLALALYYFEWIGTSATRHTGRLSLAALAGLAVMVLGLALAGPRATAGVAAALLAASLVTLWLATRGLGPPVRLGRALPLLLVCVSSVAAGSALAWLAPRGPAGTALKLGLLLLALLGVARAGWTDAAAGSATAGAPVAGGAARSSSS